MHPFRSGPRFFRLLVLWLILGTLLLAGQQPAFASGSFITAPSRVDMVHDSQRDRLYITSGSSILRYDLRTGTFLTPIQLSGALKGIDISPDNKLLAVADTTRGSDTLWMHLVDLSNDTSRKVSFTREFGEGGSFTVAFGADGAALVSSTYEGSGWVPMRRYDPATNTTQTLASVRQNTMLTSSADGSVIGFAESNSSDGPFGRYLVADRTLLRKSGYTYGTSWFNYEIGVARNGSQYAVPTYGGTFIHDNTLTRYATIGQYAGPQPIGVVYHPTSDIVYFAFAKTNEVRAYDTNTLQQIGSYNFEYTFDHPGNYAFTQGRLKISRDGSLLFATVGNGIRYVRLEGSPIAHNQTIAATEDIPQAIKLLGSEKEGVAATYAVLTQPSHGTLSGVIPNLTYTPATNYNGPDSFTFRINQNGIDSNIGTISIDVRAANDRPIAVSDQASTQKGTPVAINVLSNDSDIDKQPLTISAVTHPANGTIATYNGTITYTPNQTFSGQDSFTYTVSDGQGGTATASVVVTVIDPAAPPVADNQQVSTD
jgi:hypothetical protein